MKHRGKKEIKKKDKSKNSHYIELTRIKWIIRILNFKGVILPENELRFKKSVILCTSKDPKVPSLYRQESN